MSLRIRFAPAMLAWLLLGACPTTGAPSSPPNVLVLVFEGLRGDRFDRILHADDSLALPAWQRLARYSLAFPDSLANDLDGNRGILSLCTGRASFAPRTSHTASTGSNFWLPTVLAANGWPDLLNTASRSAATRAEHRAWVEAKRGAPFAAQVDQAITRLHENPREPWSLWLTSGELRWPLEDQGAERSAEHFRRRDELGLVSVEQRIELQQSYDEHLRALDHQLTRLLEALDRTEQFERTLFIVVSTVGTGLGEGGQYGQIGKHAEQLRAPWLIRMPGARTQRIETALTQPSDMPASLLEALASSAPYSSSEFSVPRPMESMNSIDRLRVCRTSTEYLLDEGGAWRLRIRYRGSQIVLDDLRRLDLSASPAPTLDSRDGRAVAGGLLLRYQSARYRQSLHDRHARESAQ